MYSKFNTKRTVEKCKAKIKYLIEKYKTEKDWNTKQSGGNRKESLFYEEIDAVLGYCGIATLRHVAEAGDSKNSDNSAENGTEESETNPANRAERKRKRKREEEEEKEQEERKLMLAALLTFEEQRQEMRDLIFKRAFTRSQEQQSNTMNVLVGALTNFLTHFLKLLQQRSVGQSSWKLF